MFKLLWLSSSHRINKHENHLASVSVGFTSSKQGDTFFVSVEYVEVVTDKGWKKSTTAQLEQLCLERGICGFVATLSLGNAAQCRRQPLLEDMEYLVLLVWQERSQGSRMAMEMYQCSLWQWEYAGEGDREDSGVPDVL